IHPYRALWDERVPSPRSPYGESEASLFASTDATPAGQAAECAHKTKKDGDAYKAGARTQPTRADVSADYVLTLKAPPKPPGATTLRVRVVDRGSTVDPHWTTAVANGTLTVRFHLASTPNVRLVLAKQVFLGWRRLSPALLPVHLRVTFTKLLTRRAMDPGCPNAPHGCGTPESVLDDEGIRKLRRGRRARGDPLALSGRRGRGRRTHDARQPCTAVDVPGLEQARVLPALVECDAHPRRRSACLAFAVEHLFTEPGGAMAGTRRNDLLGRLADLSEEAIQRLSDAPGADRVLGAMNTLRDRMDELQKRVRGLEELEKRLTAL